jgi:thiol-disulfide isomerase/thioredoxin
MSSLYPNSTTLSSASRTRSFGRTFELCENINFLSSPSIMALVLSSYLLSAIAETEKKYEECSFAFIEGELRKFIFSQSSKVLPKLLVLDADESVVEFGYREDILVVNFWATWCAPCKKEMPSLNNLAEHMKDNDVRIITVASGRNSKEAIDAFFTKNNLANLDKFRDLKGKVAISYGVTALPTTVVIDTTGREIGRIIGDIDWSTADIRTFLRKLATMN